MTGVNIELEAGIMRRELNVQPEGVSTKQICIAGREALLQPASELQVTLRKYMPGSEPQGILPGEEEAVETTAVFGHTDTLDIDVSRTDEEADKDWGTPAELDSASWGHVFRLDGTKEERLPWGGRMVSVRYACAEGEWAGLSVQLNYEIEEDHPAIRKSVEFHNDGDSWIRLERLMLEKVQFNWTSAAPLTPSGQGALSSLIAYGEQDGRTGVIAGSEIPSALRYMGGQGTMGYAEEWFEWTIGPGESFRSEPVFLYAYEGESLRYADASSTALDRTVEGRFQHYLRERIGINTDTDKLPAPLWCSWSNFAHNVNQEDIRRQTGLAAQAGFKMVQIDAGWQKDGLGMDVDTEKFPDFAGTCRHVLDSGLQLGLWVSCFRGEDSQDLKDLPEGRSLPVIKRNSWGSADVHAIGMSFASAWRDYYADQLAELHRTWGITYYKQDLSNIRFGDIARGHESRTKKESYLRGLRGLLKSQQRLKDQAPDVTLQLTHEIYWGTPGVPCDLAALQAADTYHIPPNDYSGTGPRKQRFSPDWKQDPEELRKQLIQGCWNARQRFYEHRGLPLWGIEYYGAATVSVGGSLTPMVQDRQICSWLMGAPFVYAGDLSSLSEEQLAHYRHRFGLLQRLQERYGIYRYFQFSGVPEPTDEGWHWWGKLREDGSGAVVVLRGSKGENRHKVYVPWVDRDSRYRAERLLEPGTLGEYSGVQLQEGIELELPVYGQDIIELARLD